MSASKLKEVVTNGEPQPKASPHEVFKSRLESARTDLLAYLGNEKEFRKFVSTCVSAVIERPELLSADARSLLSSCKKAARDGLMPDGRQAVLNIYSTKDKDPASGREIWVKKVQYLPMVAGVVKMMYEAGCTYVDAAAVYANDQFTFKRGDVCQLEHVPTGADDPGPIVAAYAVVKMATGEIKREVMWKRDIDRVKAASKSPGGPWTAWPDQMAIKSVLHRIRKQIDVYSERFDRMLADDLEASGMVITQAQGASIVDVTTRGESDAPPAALAHDPSETLDMPLPPITYAQITEAIHKAKSSDEMDIAADLIGEIADDGQRKELAALVKDARAKIGG